MTKLKLHNSKASHDEKQGASHFSWPKGLTLASYHVRVETSLWDHLQSPPCVSERQNFCDSTSWSLQLMRKTAWDKRTIQDLLWGCDPSLCACCSRWCSRKAGERELASFTLSPMYRPSVFKIRHRKYSHCIEQFGGLSEGLLKVKTSTSPLLFQRAEQKYNPGDKSSRSGSAIKCDQKPFLIWNGHTGMKHVKVPLCFLFPDIFFSTILPPPPNFYQLLDAKVVK